MSHAIIVWTIDRFHKLPVKIEMRIKTRVSIAALTVKFRTIMAPINHAPAPVPTHFSCNKIVIHSLYYQLGNSEGFERMWGLLD
jgi:hypothetical protein